ncbi:MAG: HAD family hydrolase [Candidatus Aenigmatarchaeota archaeon]
MEIELFIFDWSGTISDDRKPVYETNIRLMKHFNKPVLSFEEWLPKVKMTILDFFDSIGIDKNHDELFLLYEKLYTEVHDSGIAPQVYPDAHEILQNLKNKGKKIAILSSHPAKNVRREAEHYNLIQLIDFISGSSRNKVEGLLNVCRHFRIDSASALYVGDMIYDIRSAKLAGVKSAAVCTGYHAKAILEKENPELILNSLSELGKII